MKLMRLILVAMLIATMMPVALSQGSYLSPYIGQIYPTDWLEGGYVSSFDRSTMMDPGIAGMVSWLDAPVPSFSWYSSDASFYKQMVPASTFLPSKTNDLWVRVSENWTQYLVSPVGMTLELIANVPAGGLGNFYQTIQTETSSQKSKMVQFNAGYNTMKFNADQIGRHILYFIADNQPSNVVIVDVFAQAPQAQPSTYSVTDSANAQQYLSPSQMPATAPSSGDVPVTISYPNPGGFQVYVDGAYVGTGANGNFTFKTKGGMSHVISIWDGFWMYQKSIYFESGLPKVINVEAI